MTDSTFTATIAKLPSESLEDFIQRILPSRVGARLDYGKRLDHAVHALKAIAAAMKEVDPDLQKISIDYYGSGDSGYTESIKYDSKASQSLSETIASLDDTIGSYAWDVASNQNPGFEINEGGQGTVEICADPDADSGWSVHLHHEENRIITDYYQYQF